MSKSPQIAVINGPNLNLLGTREPEIYGSTTLQDIHQDLEKHAKGLGVSLTFFQSNHEGEIIDHIHSLRETHSAILINPGAFTHTSVAILDALSSVQVPTFEVHLSNIHQREEFRHKSYISKVARGIVCGFGADSYRLALEGAVKSLKST